MVANAMPLMASLVVHGNEHTKQGIILLSISSLSLHTAGCVPLSYKQGYNRPQLTQVYRAYHCVEYRSNQHGLCFAQSKSSYAQRLLLKNLVPQLFLSTIVKAKVAQLYVSLA